MVQRQMLKGPVSLLRREHQEDNTRSEEGLSPEGVRAYRRSAAFNRLSQALKGEKGPSLVKAAELVAQRLSKHNGSKLDPNAFGGTRMIVDDT